MQFFSISSTLKRCTGNPYSSISLLCHKYGHLKQVKVEAKKIAKNKIRIISKKIMSDKTIKVRAITNV